MIDKILIIDDDADIRFTLNEICQMGNYVTEQASCGHEGYELANRFKPDLIISDYHMPGWDGLKTVKEIRKQQEDVVILVLTVDERQEVADKFMLAGATDFAIKPIKAPDLLARIKINLSIKRMQEKMHEKNERVFVEKGISTATLSIIVDYLSTCSEPVGLSEISRNVNLAYQTIHRYVNYLVEQQKLEVTQIYGHLGRPKNKYKLI